MGNTYATTLLQEAYDVKGKAFWKVFMENIEGELKSKRFDLENVQPDRLQFIQGYIQALRFVVGDTRGDKKGIVDKMIEAWKNDGTTDKSAPKE